MALLVAVSDNLRLQLLCTLMCTGVSLSLFCNYTAVDLLLACMYVCMYACMLACILQMPAEQCQLVADTALYMHVRVACSLHSSKHPCTHAPMLEGVRSPW